MTALSALPPVLLSCLLLCPTDPAAATGTSPPDTADTTDETFETRVREYLLNNPGVVVEAIERWRTQQAEAETARVAALIDEHREALFRHPDDPVGGNPDGDVTLVEFMDYNCVFCRRIYPALLDLRQQDPALRVVFKEFPILGLGSEFAAKAALAARQQALYQPFHDAMMQVEGVLDEDRVLTIAGELGLDLARLRADMDNPGFETMFQRNYSLAQDLGITGTPSFVIGERLVDGAVDLETLQTLVREARETAEGD